MDALTVPPTIPHGRWVGPPAALRREPDLRSIETPSPGAAARLLDGWGFLVNADLPEGPAPGLLLVGLRSSPELRHYDPEQVEFWVADDGCGRRLRLSAQSAVPEACEFAWGRIRIFDRLGATNEWLTFGGTMTADRVGATTVVVFASPAPLLRRGGHSQGWDPGADTAAAFFGRLMVAVDYVSGFEGRLAAATPLERYAAFVEDLSERFRSSAVLRDADPTLARLIRAEARRLAEREAAAWAAGSLLGDAARVSPSPWRNASTGPR
jgi:hypothetical protein